MGQVCQARRRQLGPCLYTQPARRRAHVGQRSDVCVCVCSQPAGSLVAKCRSLDQGRSVVTFLDAASEKALRSTVALTASRGRGKVSESQRPRAAAAGLSRSLVWAAQGGRG